MNPGNKDKKQQTLRQTCIYRQHRTYPLQTKGKGTPMPRVYTRYVAVHRCLHPIPLLKFARFRKVRRKRQYTSFNLKQAKPWTFIGRQPIASHPQQDSCKGNKKNWKDQRKEFFSQLFHKKLTKTFGSFKKTYLCTNRIRHASHQNSEPGQNFFIL